MTQSLHDSTNRSDSPQPPADIDLLVVHASDLLTCRPKSTNARGIRGHELDELEVIHDGAVAVRDGRIVDVGRSDDLLAGYHPRQVIDAGNRLVTPGFVDSHTHLIHGGSRHLEWADRLRGHKRGSVGEGIHSTVRATRAESTEELRAAAQRRLDVMCAHGTTTVEVKSGYGLTANQEQRLLEIASSLEHPVDVVRTFLGAHVMPEELAGDRPGAVNAVIQQLPLMRPLAEYCDLCCDPVAYTRAECRRMADAALSLGYKMRVHADQSGHFEGAEFAVEIGASSVDHLDYVSPEAISMLASSNTAAVLLPGVNFHLMQMVPARPGADDAADRQRELIKRYHQLASSGAIVALATDYNPGTSPTLSMQMAMQLAGHMYGFSVEQIWHMATYNAAVSLDREEVVGSLEVGKQADIVIWQVSHPEQVVEQFGTNLVDRTIKAGELMPSADPALDSELDATR